MWIGILDFEIKHSDNNLKELENIGVTDKVHASFCTAIVVDEVVDDLCVLETIKIPLHN